MLDILKLIISFLYKQYKQHYDDINRFMIDITINIKDNKFIGKPFLYINNIFTKRYLRAFWRK